MQKSLFELQIITLLSSNSV